MLRMSSIRLQNLALTFSSSFLSSSASFQNQPEPISSKLKILDKRVLNHDCYIYKLGWAGPKFKLRIG